MAIIHPCSSLSGCFRPDERVCRAPLVHVLKIEVTHRHINDLVVRPVKLFLLSWAMFMLRPQSHQDASSQLDSQSQREAESSIRQVLPHRGTEAPKHRVSSPSLLTCSTDGPPRVCHDRILSSKGGCSRSPRIGQAGSVGGKIIKAVKWVRVWPISELAGDDPRNRNPTFFKAPFPNSCVAN